MESLPLRIRIFRLGEVVGDGRELSAELLHGNVGFDVLLPLCNVKCKTPAGFQWMLRRFEASLKVSQYPEVCPLPASPINQQRRLRGGSRRFRRGIFAQN